MFSYSVPALQKCISRKSNTAKLENNDTTTGIKQVPVKGNPSNENKETPEDEEENSESHLQQNNDGVQKIEKKLTRKRTRNPERWACNIRKEKFDRGLEYISSRKKLRPARNIKTQKDCFEKCVYKCAKNISDEERKQLFSDYYKLNSSEKRMYILSTTEMSIPQRRRKGKNAENSKKSKTFKFFFILSNKKIQVCKLFYCGTLGISQKPIYTVYKHSTETNTLRKSIQGKHRKKVTSDEAANLVREHIKMFPVVESHYCRADIKRQYIEGDLSIRKMYDMYEDFIREKGLTPVKINVYRKIFCTEFNYSFNKPSKDLCDLCAEIDRLNKENTLNEVKKNEYEKHLQEKILMRQEKKKDVENGKAVLCFDLENVLTCPKGDVKNFFYKSKLNVYNMTAHLSINRTVYCAIWSEAMHGRAGNDIASAIYRILKRVLEDYPLLEELILWSDSCVPQNRNSLLSFAIAHILKTSSHLKKIQMKFSVPGHSCIQEVDSVHSAIERSLRKSEYFSPLSLLRVLLKVNTRKPYIILQMKEQDFLDFSWYSSKLNYSAVPFSKVVSLQFTKSFHEIGFRTSFNDHEYKIISLRQRTVRKHVTAETEEIPTLIKKNDTKINLAQNKVEALKSMYRWMPEVDKNFYVHIFSRMSEDKK